MGVLKNMLIGFQEMAVPEEPCNRCGESTPVDEFMGSECRFCASIKWGAR